MIDDFAIKVEGDVANWSPWCSEKAAKAAYFAASAVDGLWKAGLSEQTHPELWYALFYSVENTTRLWAFSRGLLSEYRASDAEIILKNGSAGYETIAIRYGVRRDTDPSAIRDLRGFVAEAGPYLVDFPRHDERTLLYDVIRRCRVRHPLIRRLSTILDEVSMGNRPWQDFLPEAQSILAALLK